MRALGEVYGTRELPAFVEQVLCSVASHRPVVLALEYPRGEQPALDAYFASPNTVAAEARLLKRPFWNMVPGDGRESQAWFTVLRDVRAWRRQGLRISVTAYDEWPSPQEREAANAAFLSELLQQQKYRAFVVIYSGNAHAMKTVLEGVQMETPMGIRLSKWDLLHLNMASPGGHAWFCSSEADDSCGTHEWTFSRTPPPAAGTIRMGYPTAAYDGVFGVGPITASPPAREALAPH
jgi:hypothetical protein